MKIETMKSNKTVEHGQKNGIKIKTCVDQFQSPSLWYSKRFFVAVVIFICFVNVNMVMLSINITIVEMTSPRTIVVGNRTIVWPAEFQWDPSMIGIISSLHSYGGLFSLIGGLFVNKLGGSLSCAFVTMICAILTIFQPAALYLDFRLFIAFRFLIGLFANCFYVSVAEVYSKWFPKQERSTLISFCCNGANVGVTIMNPLFGYIADRLGWRMVFYISGVISMAVSLLCLIAVKNRPSQDKLISNEELSYILDGTHDIPSKQISHPYKKILTSPAVWALCLVDFTALWIDNIIGGCLPLYAKDLTGRSTDEIGLLSSIPVAITIVLYPLTGTFMDYWKNHSDVSHTRLDKIIIGSVFLSISVLFAACAVFSNFSASMVIFVTIQIIKTTVPPVLEPNIVNIAPNDSSIVTGLSKLSTSVGVIVSRTLVGFMTMNHTSQEWNNCFLMTSGVSIIGAAIFVKYGSSEAQSWSLLPYAEGERDFLIKKPNINNNLY